MSDASQIPNLLSLRGRGGGGRRGLGRSRGGGAQASSGGPAGDSTIQGTDNDAATSRISAVECGYLEDPYATYFDQSMGPRDRRLPIINRGTYTRTTGIDMLVNAFLSGPDTKQIVSLGAGTDTRPYRKFSQILSRPFHGPLIYHEIDFEVVTSKKARITKSVPLLSKIFPDVTVSENGASWSSVPAEGLEYHCHGLDLRKLADSWETSSLPGLRADIPTLLLSECCLCYLAPEQADSLLSHFTTMIKNIGIVIYEPIRPNDPFGKIMTSNLGRRGIQMPTLEVYPDLSDQEKRLRALGMEHATAVTVEDVWRLWLAADERERVDALEGLDEVEEWKLLAEHYTVNVGFRGNGLGLFDSEEWEGRRPNFIVIRDDVSPTRRKLVG